MTASETKSTVVVAPLAQNGPGLDTTKLHPPILVEGKTYLLVTEEMAAVHRSIFGRHVASAEVDRPAIIRAIDLCFTGI